MCKIYILPSCQFRMEPGPHLEQRAYPPFDLYASRGRRGDAGEDLKEGGFTGAVAADDADDFALFDFEIDVF